MALPLAGVTIVDFTRILSGPFATMILADLGAAVIKIERPGSGDGARALPPLKDGKSGYFAAVNRGKRSLALDFDVDADRALLDRIIARADVLVENFRPGVMDRRGLGWDVLHARHPELIYASVTGFGQTGPDARRAAYDVIVQARAGLMGRTGTPDTPRRAGSSFGDLSGGMFLAQGILAALYDRARTGLGRRVDVGMLDAQLALMEQAVPQEAIAATPPPHPSRHPTIAPCEAILASDGPFVLAAGTEAQFERLCLVLDLPIAGDARFADNAARLANARLLNRLIEAATRAGGGTRCGWACGGRGATRAPTCWTVTGAPASRRRAIPSRCRAWKTRPRAPPPPSLTATGRTSCAGWTRVDQGARRCRPARAISPPARRRATCRWPAAPAWRP